MCLLAKWYIGWLGGTGVLPRILGATQPLVAQLVFSVYFYWFVKIRPGLLRVGGLSRKVYPQLTQFSHSSWE